MTDKYINIAFVRREIQDRFPDDNTIEQDQFFTDEDILHAMERAAADYNSMSPIGVDIVSPTKMTTKSTVFIDAVVSHLYKTAIHKISRNLISWQTGESTVDIDGTRMKAFQALRDILEKEWRIAAKERKVEINRMQAYAYI